MINIISKIEDALSMAGIEYELLYLPDLETYVLKIDDEAVFIMNAKEKEND